MTTTVVLDPERLPRTSWRNGTGATRLVASGGVRDATWRVSLADIDGPCRFSRFPETWRWSLVAAGSGLTVSVDGAETDVRRGDVLDYSGTSAVETRPFPGSDLPVEVLNLMVTASDGTQRTGSMTTRTVDGSLTWSPDVVAVLVLDGALLTDDTVASAGQFLLAPAGTAAPGADHARCVELAVSR